MSERREELLEKALAYLLEKGVADLSLRPLAAATGTSARLLVYHFGSKEELVTAVMETARTRFQASFARSLGGRSGPADEHPLSAFWKSLSRPANLPYLRLLLEVQVLALQNPSTWARYLEGNSTSWLEVIEAALPPSKRNRTLATLCAAVIDGLILELLSTGDRRRATAALDLFIERLNATSSLPSAPRTSK